MSTPRARRWKIPRVRGFRISEGATAEDGFRKRLTVIDVGEELGGPGHDTQRWLVWIDEIKLTAPLLALIMPLVKSGIG